MKSALTAGGSRPRQRPLSSVPRLVSFQRRAAEVHLFRCSAGQSLVEMRHSCWKCVARESVPAMRVSSSHMSYLSVTPGGCLWGMKAPSLPLCSFMTNSALQERQQESICLQRGGRRALAAIHTYAGRLIHACLQQRRPRFTNRLPRRPGECRRARMDALTPRY